MFNFAQWKIRYVILCGLIAIGSIACTKSSDSANEPKGRIKEYIAQSFSVKNSADRAILSAFLTGSAKNRLEGWSEEQFREAFVESKREFIKLVFQEVKTISPHEVEITYELTYQDRGKGRDGRSHQAKVINKKLCQMVLENGKWYIADVKNIKELVEYGNELSLP